MCNYATFHRKCPVSRAREREVLPTAIVRDVLNELGEHNYQGELCFHNYNEPLLDPRLLMLIVEAGQRCPGIQPFLWTNGFYLTQDLVEDLEKAGLKKIVISAYSDVELHYLEDLEFSCDVTLQRVWQLDDVLQMYDWPEQECTSPCFAPLGDVIIHSDGRMGLCCLDWKRTVTFGSLKEQRLGSVLARDEVRKVCDGLRAGQRTLALCRRCHRISCGGNLRDL
jgi:hypothetical protein